MILLCAINIIVLFNVCFNCYVQQMTRDFSASFVIFATCHSFKTSMPSSIATWKTSYDDRTIVKGTWDKHWQCLEREKCMNHLILKQMVRIAHCAKRRSRTVDKDRLSEWKRIFAVILKIFILFSDFIKSSQHTIRKIKFLSKNSILTKLYNFLGKSKLSTTKKCKSPTFSRVFTQIFFDNFYREIKLVNS